MHEEVKVHSISQRTKGGRKETDCCLSLVEVVMIL